MSATAIAYKRESPSGDSLTTYLNEIRAYPLLTRGDEVALAHRIHAGDALALERLVCSNLRFVVSVAKKYQEQGLPLADLINEGNLGLMRAAEKFDESKGVRFISYAVWWIRQAIVQSVADHAHIVRVPLSRTNVLRRFGRRANALRQELGREPTQREVAAALDIKDARIVGGPIAIAPSCVSLDDPAGETDGNRLLDYLRDDATAPPDRDATDDNLTTSVEAALAGLRVRDALVLRLHFGLDSGESMTLEDIGRQLGITRERVRQIKEHALSRLRKSSCATALASLCDN